MWAIIPGNDPMRDQMSINCEMVLRNKAIRRFFLVMIMIMMMTMMMMMMMVVELMAIV